METVTKLVYPYHDQFEWAKEIVLEINSEANPIVEYYNCGRNLGIAWSRGNIRMAATLVRDLKQIISPEELKVFVSSWFKARESGNRK